MYHAGLPRVAVTTDCFVVVLGGQDMVPPQLLQGCLDIVRRMMNKNPALGFPVASQPLLVVYEDCSWTGFVVFVRGPAGDDVHGVVGALQRGERALGR